MKITNITYKTAYTQKNVNKTNENLSFKAYTFYPQGAKKTIADLNPIKAGVDKIIERTLLIANMRVKKLAPNLEGITQTIKLNDKAGKPLTYAWDINPDNRQKYLLFLHGTGQNITNLQPMYKTLVDNTKFALFVPEFRGMGANPQAPLSSKRFLEDATSALEFLKSKGIESKDIVVAGHSLGAQIAANLASKNKDLGGVVLMSPIDSFLKNMSLDDSLKNSTSRLARFLQKRSEFLNKDFDEFYAVGRLMKKIESPVSIIHSKDDNFVQAISAQQVAAKCKNLHSLAIVNEGSHKLEKNKIDAFISALDSILGE